MGYFQGFGDYANTTGASLTVINGNSARWQNGNLHDTQNGNTTLVWTGNLNSVIKGLQTTWTEGFKFSTTAGAAFSTIAGADITLQVAGVIETSVSIRLIVFGGHRWTVKKGFQTVANYGFVFDFHNANTLLFTKNKSEVTTELAEFGASARRFHESLNQQLQELEITIGLRFEERVYSRICRSRMRQYDVSRMDIRANQLQLQTPDSLMLMFVDEIILESIGIEIPAAQNGIIQLN